jgi:hypothetical protein
VRKYFLVAITFFLVFPGIIRARIGSELGIAIDVYKVENGLLKRICGEWFDLFT